MGDTPINNYFFEFEHFDECLFEISRGNTFL